MNFYSCRSWFDEYMFRVVLLNPMNFYSCRSWFDEYMFRVVLLNPMNFYSCRSRERLSCRVW